MNSGNGSIKSEPATPKRSNFRWVLAVFATLMTFMTFLDRVNLSAASPEIMRELHFTKVQIGTLQTVFFLCYALLQVPAGTVTEYFGHRKIIPLALAWWSAFTSLTAACGAFPAWVIVRGLFGMGESPVYPGLNGAFGNWFPKHERGRAVACLSMGARFGTVAGFPLTVFIMVALGWRAVFLLYGAAGLVLALAYYLLLRTHPRESKFVNEAELKYIADGQTMVADQKKVMPPWKDFFRSSQFWAIGIQFAMIDYISYVFVAWLPVYFIEAHHFSLKQMGFAAALPELGYALGIILGGIAGDYFIGKKKTGSKSRTWFAMVGFVLCGIGLYMAGIAEGRWATVFWLSFALMFLGLPTISAWTACTDLGGRFSGTVSGWMNFCGNIVGSMAPVLTAWIATHYGWQPAIVVTSATGIVGTITWIFVRPDVPLKHRYSEPVQVAARA